MQLDMRLGGNVPLLNFNGTLAPQAPNSIFTGQSTHMTS